MLQRTSKKIRSEGKHGVDMQRPRITEEQLRALNRKHLFIMIYDLEKELAQEKREKENLLRVCQMSIMQRQQLVETV